MVWLNPWELACIAEVKGVSVREFRDLYCEFGGIRLRFNGEPGWNGLSACSQFSSSQGCCVHAGRPLACRLFPLGRERRGESQRYMYLGNLFPCFDGCPEVIDQPHLTVAEYTIGQDVALGEAAQDAYIELMEALADGAFALLLESGLDINNQELILNLWQRLGNNTPEKTAGYLESSWLDKLMLPEIDKLDDPVEFSRLHHDLLQAQALKTFGTLTDAASVRKASGVMMGLALHLGRGLGIEPKDLVANWIATANQYVK